MDGRERMDGRGNCGAFVQWPDSQTDGRRETGRQAAGYCSHSWHMGVSNYPSILPSFPSMTPPRRAVPQRQASRQESLLDCRKMMMMGMRASERVAQGPGRPAVAVNSLARADGLSLAARREEGGRAFNVLSLSLFVT